MTSEQKNQILELTGRKLSSTEFAEKYPNLVDRKYLLSEIETAISNKDHESIEYLIYLIDFFPEQIKPQILSDLIALPWHFMHESLIAYIQHDYPDKFIPNNIGIAIFHSYPYMDMNDYSNYIRNCILVLKKSKLEGVKDVLEKIKNSDNAFLKEYI